MDPIPAATFLKSRDFATFKRTQAPMYEHILKMFLRMFRLNRIESRKVFSNS